jgi:hypothetical protein
VERLQKLTEEIAECYRHARECRELAKQAADPAIKRDFLDQEQRWLSLAWSYELAEWVSNFTPTPPRKPHRAH